MANVVQIKESLLNEEAESKLRNKFLLWVNEAEGSTPETKWREESVIDYAFYAGDQDTQEVKAKLSEQNRPNSTFNKVLPKINMLIGLAAQSNRVPYIYSTSSEDQAMTEIMNGAFKYFRNKAKLKRNEIECFEHTVKSGRSFLYFFLGGSNPFKPQIKTARLPGRDVLVDPLSKEYDLSDARYVIIDKWLFEDDIKSMFPQLNLDDIKNFSQSKNDTPSYYDEVADKYRLSEIWYREWVKVIWFRNPLSGQIESVSEADFEKVVSVLEQGVPTANGVQQIRRDQIQAVPRMIKTVRRAIFTNTKVVEESASPFKFKINDEDILPVVQYGAFREEDTNQWFSVIRGMRDAQRLENTVKRQFVHLLNTSQKNILVHAVGALADEEDYDKNSSKPNYRLQVNPQFWDKWQFTPQPQIPQAYAQLMQISEQDMKDTSGVQDSLLGVQTSSREPGVTAKMRMDTNIAVLYVLFDNFRESRILGGKILLGMIQQFVTEEQIIRIEGIEGAQNIKVNQQMNPQAPKINDLGAGDYDLVVDETVDNVTMRMSIAGMLNDFSQNNPETIPPELIMEYMDVPLSAQQKVIQFRQQQLAIAQAEQEREIAGKLADTALRDKQKTQGGKNNGRRD